MNKLKEGWRGRGAWAPAAYWSGALALCAFFAELSITGTLLVFFVDDVLHVSHDWVGVILTTQYIAAGLGQVLTGLVADRFGHRYVLSILVAANAVLLNLQGQTRDVRALLAVRICLGVVATYAPALTWVADVSPPGQLPKNLSRSVLLAQVTVGLGGLVGGALRGHDFATASSAISVVPILTTVLLLSACKPSEVVMPTAGRDVLRDLSATLKTRPFQALAWCLLLHGVYLGFALAVPPLILKEVHSLSESATGRIFQVGGLLTVICHAWITPRLTQSTPVRGTQVLVIGLAALMVAIGVFGETSGAAVCVLAVAAYVMNFVSVACCNLLVMLAAKKSGPLAAGAVNGIARCLFTLGAGFSPLVSTLLLDAVGLWLPCSAIAILLLSAAVALGCARTSELLPPPSPLPASVPDPATSSKQAEDTGDTGATEATRMPSEQRADVT